MSYSRSARPFQLRTTRRSLRRLREKSVVLPPTLTSICLGVALLRLGKCTLSPACYNSACTFFPLLRRREQQSFTPRGRGCSSTSLYFLFCSVSNWHSPAMVSTPFSTATFITPQATQ